MVNTSISRPSARASSLTSCTRFAAPSSDVRVPAVAVKKASQLRSAKLWPVPEEPAFMIIGRVPPNGFGLARTPASLKNSPGEVEIALLAPGAA